MTRHCSLTKEAFLLRFAQLQGDLKHTLHKLSQPEIMLSAQDRLILRLEGWIDSLADLHMITSVDLDIFRLTLSANRQAYRLKVLMLHNIAIPDGEAAAAVKAGRLTCSKIISANKSSKSRPEQRSACLH